MNQDQSLPSVICILGMHRSGTSCLTGSLQQAGVELGKHHTWNPYNRKGNRENQDVVDFHEALLESNGAAWDRPPKAFSYGDADVAAAQQLVMDSSEGKPWGFKDPRALLAHELWQRAVPNIRYVGIFRHPHAVASSLSSRSGGEMSLEQGYALWMHYNKVLYRLYREYRFPMLCFDWPQERFLQRLGGVIDTLGLQLPEGEEPFYTPNLRSSDSDNWSGVPWAARWLYYRLSRAAR